MDKRIQLLSQNEKPKGLYTLKFFRFFYVALSHNGIDRMQLNLVYSYEIRCLLIQVLAPIFNTALRFRNYIGSFFVCF